jgi:hypothetical protein
LSPGTLIRSPARPAINKIKCDLDRVGRVFAPPSSNLVYDEHSVAFCRWTTQHTIH